MFNQLKGWLGEKVTQAGIWLVFDKSIYRPFHNLIVETRTSTTQIDHVLLSHYGLFVIETKNYDGWIYGGKEQKQWTQVLNGKKYPFQNPLHQNYLHTKVLAETLNINEGFIFSIIFFVGDAELKTDMPPNVLTRSLAAYIYQFQEVVFDENERQRLELLLTRTTQAQISNKDHVRNLQERFSSRSVCPKCGSPLVNRVASKGVHAGTEFTGCSSYPVCKYIQKKP